MRLPKWLGDKIVEYQGDLEYEYQTLCYDAGYEYDGVPDDEHDLYWWLRFNFNEEYVGNTVYVHPDFGELWASVWLPSHKWLKLCKIGWHRRWKVNGKFVTLRCIHCSYSKVVERKSNDKA